MRLLVINDKRPGSGDSAIYDFIRAMSGDCAEIVVRNVCDASTKVVPALLTDAESFDVVVASGGDDTVAAVCHALRYREVAIVPFPDGNGGLLSRNLSSPQEPRAIADMVKKGNVEYYDLAEVSYTDADGNQVTKGFAVMANVGYGAMIVGSQTGLKSSLGHGMSRLTSLIGDKPKKAKISLTIDGKKHHTTGVGVILVNFAKIASGAAVTHVNDAQDGLLEVAVIKPDGRLAMAPARFAAFLDRDGQFPSRMGGLEVLPGTQVEVVTEPSLPLQIDGELAAAYAPITARILPRALKAIVDDEEVVRLENIRLLDATK